MHSASIFTGTDDDRQNGMLAAPATGRPGGAVLVPALPETGGADLPSEEAIRRLVDRFYARVRRDEVLGPVFARALGESDAAWAPHLARLHDFWSSVMLRSGRYHRDPFSAHLRLPGLAPAMFDRWLALFGQTCAEMFEPEMAGAFRERAERIGRSLRLGLFERLPARPGPASVE